MIIEPTKQEKTSILESLLGRRKEMKPMKTQVPPAVKFFGI